MINNTVKAIKAIQLKQYNQTNMIINTIKTNPKVVKVKLSNAVTAKIQKSQPITLILKV